MNDAQDLGVLDTCAECGDPIDGSTWFWYADGGSIHLTFHQDCKPDADGFERVERVTGVRLVDSRAGEEFVRLVRVPDDWF